MRKDEIDASAMNVESLAEQLDRHRRTFEMPAGPPTAPRRVPRRARHLVVRCRRLPQGEVLSVLLRIIVLRHPGARLQLTLVQSRKLPVRRELLDREIH